MALWQWPHLLEQYEEHDGEEEDAVHICGEDHVEDAHRVYGDGAEEDEGGDPRTSRDKDLAAEGCDGAAF
eukprot:scaffold10351_cov62-Phaeocystis_antarctica.AAC.12